MWSTGPWRETDEYKEAHARDLHGTGGRLDPICLSHTHDPDYAEYRAYPKGKGPKRGARERHLGRHTPAQAAARAAELKADGEYV